VGAAVSWRSLISSGERVAREIFRVDQFERGSLRQLARTAANRALLDARHTNLVVEFRKWRWERDQQALESHLIDREGFEHISRNDAEAFLRGRAARLRTLVSSFIERRAGSVSRAFSRERVLRPTGRYRRSSKRPTKEKRLSVTF
jgi:hypothetical protein